MHERLNYILEQVNENKSVKTSDLAKELNVSTVTIRNDLQTLHNQDKLVKTHGGAMHKENTISHNTSFNYRQFQNVPKKRAIIKEALNLIKNGQTIMLDASSTCLLLANELSRFDQLTVVTNGIYSMLVLKDFPQITTIFVGGIVTHNSGSTEGTLGQGLLDSIKADIAFTSSHSISVDEGLSDFNYYEVQLKQQMLKRTNKVVALVDSTKFGKGSVASYIELDKIDMIYTDDEIDVEYQQGFEEQDVKLKICKTV